MVFPVKKKEIYDYQIRKQLTYDYIKLYLKRMPNYEMVFTKGFSQTKWFFCPQLSTCQ